MATYLITGCSRGLGLELVKQLTKASSASVGVIFAAARGNLPSKALEEIIRTSDGVVRFISLDVLDAKGIATAVDEVTKQLGDKGLDVLINNAGIQILEKDGASGMHVLETTLSTNVVAVHNVTMAFIPLLTRGNAKKIANISSSLGSMAMKDYSAQAPFPSYKISKAALNMLTVQYHLDLGPKGFTVFAVNPGWLQTDLGGPHADLPPAVGAQAVMDIIYGVERKDGGAFKSIHVPGNDFYDGENPPW